jgi:hypothetical protein
MTRLLAFLTICAALHCFNPSWAQEPPPNMDEWFCSHEPDPASCLAKRGYSTTHRVADCLTDPDLAICLLRIEARRMSFRRRPEFAHAPAVVALIDEAHKSEPERDDPQSRAYYEAETRPFNEVNSVIAAALEADRRGAAPNVALRPIANFGLDVRPQVFLSQIVTMSGAELRLFAYGEIWNAYAQGRNGVRSTLIAPPSLALAQATLALWERELRSEVVASSDPSLLASSGRTSGHEIRRLAGAFAALGDAAGLDRMARLDPDTVATIRLRSLLKAGRLEDASRLARRAETMPDLRLRWRTILTSLAAGRADLATPIAQDLLRDDATSDTEGPEAMAVIAAHDPAPSVDVLIEAYDSRARRAPGVATVANDSRPRDTQTPLAAEIAVAGWLARGRRERAQALLQIWRPISEAWRENHSCPRNFRFSYACYDQTVDRMEGWFRRFDENTGRLGPSAQEAVTFDLVDGRRLHRMNQVLAHETDMHEIESALGECVETAIEGGALDYAAACARLRRGDPYVAADRSLRMAAAAADAGDVALMTEMLRASLELWRSLEPVGWDWLSESASSLTRVGAALLRAEGRL